MKRTLAFTRIELVAAVFAVALLAVTSLPLFATTRDSSDKTGCFNNLRRVGLAALQYADDNNGILPPRSSTPRWPERLRSYYKDTAILTCPSDTWDPQSLPRSDSADGAPRSYILNAFDDYFSSSGTISTQGVPVSAIGEPSQTVLFGEKRSDSAHFWMDWHTLDDVSELENGRHHRSGNNSASGASNHAFVDGSVRLLTWGAAFQPINLWAVQPEIRRWLPGE